jgi:hypothetical protein
VLTVITMCWRQVIKPDATIKSVIGDLDHEDVYLSDMPWFQRGFPDNIPMRHMVEVYRFMERAIQAL